MDKARIAEILAGIDFIKKHSSRHLYHRAHKIASELLKAVKNCPGVLRAEVTGSLRRCKETVKDIDIVVSAEAKDRAAIMDFFTSYPGMQTVNAKGETKSSINTAEGVQADLRIVSDDAFPYILHHFTGSKEHNTAMRGFAKKLGIKMSEYGLFKENGERIDCKDETEIFSVFGMDYVPPELREDLGEIEAARNKTLPDLIEKESIKGILHTHTTYSDGANTLLEMADACRSMGMQYLGISDHSKIVVYANGLSVDRLKKQAEEIQALNETFTDFRIFHGAECDIMLDGSLDWRYIRQAKDCGVKLSINPDAHSIEGLRDTFWGVGIARKGWLTAEDVLNTMAQDDMSEYFMRKRQRNERKDSR